MRSGRQRRQEPEGRGLACRSRSRRCRRCWRCRRPVRLAGLPRTAGAAVCQV